MIIILMEFVLLGLCIFFCIFSYNRNIDWWEFLSGVFFVILTILIIIDIICIGRAHLYHEYDNNIHLSEYNEILANKEIAETGDDTTSLAKTEINSDIYNWNLQLDEYYFLMNNPFTNLSHCVHEYDGCDYITPIN